MKTVTSIQVETTSDGCLVRLVPQGQWPSGLLSISRVSVGLYRILFLDGVLSPLDFFECRRLYVDESCHVRAERLAASAVEVRSWRDAELSEPKDSGFILTVRRSEEASYDRLRSSLEDRWAESSYERLRSSLEEGWAAKYRKQLQGAWQPPGGDLSGSYPSPERSDVTMTKSAKMVLGTREAGQKVHHTLPIATVTACGLKCDASGRTAGGRTTFDVSKTTCTDCLHRLRTPITDAETRQAIEDAGWLRQQGEDFASLRKLVETVNEGEKLLVGDDLPFGRAVGTSAGDARSEFVHEIMLDQQQYLENGGPDANEDDDEDDEDEDEDEDDSEDETDERVTPPGGLCYEDTHNLVQKVRGVITDLRAGRAWPDDARRAAGELESCVESIVGKKEIVGEDSGPVCAGGCGGRLDRDATVGGLCAGCMKGADVLRQKKR